MCVHKNKMIISKLSLNAFSTNMVTNLAILAITILILNNNNNNNNNGKVIIRHSHINCRQSLC